MSLEREGRVWFRNALSAEVLLSLDHICALGSKPGARLPLGLADVGAMTALAQTLLPGARPVRLIAFDKSEVNNWALPWHQDRVVALRECVDVPGFANWTKKAGVWHAEPPIETLEHMLFARVHLDEADTENGCLNLALGTHSCGKIAASKASAIANGAPIENCIAQRGDVLFAKALILHRSSPSCSTAQRRAIRIDYCAAELPPPLQWAA